MEFYRNIVKAYEKELKEGVVTDVRIGIGYTGVLLEDGSLGLAYTLRDELPPTCSVMDKAGMFSGLSAYELAELWFYPGVASSAIGLATLNAVVNKNIKNNINGDITSIFDFSGKNIGMIGRFDPIIKNIKPLAKSLYILEKRPFLDSYPSWAARDILPKCDVVIITATTLINKTFLDIITWSNNAFKILLGPSSNFSPQVFEKVDIISGVKPIDKNKIIEIISQGGGTRQVLKYAEKVSIKK